MNSAARDVVAQLQRLLGQTPDLSFPITATNAQTWLINTFLDEARPTSGCTVEFQPTFARPSAFAETRQVTDITQAFETCKEVSWWQPMLNVCVAAGVYRPWKRPFLFLKTCVLAAGHPRVTR